MKVVFCTTCKGRTGHLERTFPQNLQDNPGMKFVVLDYNSQDHLCDWLRQKHTGAIEIGKLAVYSYRGEHPFRMAHAKNMAHRCGLLEGADILVNLDADNFTGPGFAEHVREGFEYFKEHHEDVYLWARMIKDGAGRLPKGIAGRIAVSKHAFLNSGGYNEKYDTWGPDDKDFTARLDRLGYVGREIHPEYLKAIMHSDKMRFREYRHAETSVGEDEFQIAGETTTIANWGAAGCGQVYRNFDFDNPIELKPFPTRIFGIGMHKTATTSLHAALGILGFDSAHWKTAGWAKTIWKEISTVGRSRTLERSYALSDLPITFLFRELDAAYPGSKFILTTRDEGKWLKSVRNHWNPEMNPYRYTWNDDPFSHKAHKLLYGQRGFDAELFLNRYRRHNAEVLEHFRNRPGDLLVMDMDKPGIYRPDSRWVDLCHFLGCPIPDVAYPTKFSTKRAGS